MKDKYGIALTTINQPTKAVQEIARDAPKLNAQFVVVGDQKSPKNFNQPGAVYLDLDMQQQSGFKYARIAPPRHYARKNIAYLVLKRAGATIIIETDDDNLPTDGFWAVRDAFAVARVVSNESWANVYSYFANSHVWPRGFPLEFVNAPQPSWGVLEVRNTFCPIQQGLADANPDVDAIYRLTLPLPIYFRRAEPLALLGAWCPFNSQNTTWWRVAFPLLYLPYYCSFRMTDIWRSFVAQRISYLNGWGILFHEATVIQERNDHNLLRDFEEEIPGYLANHRIREELSAIDLPAGEANIPSAMRRCYERLVALKIVGEQELGLLDAWLADIC
jgi:STELLO glycosyltransferase-like protein